MLAVTPWTAIPSHADLFDDARRAIRIQEPRMDSSGISVRGGVHVQTGQQASSINLLRATARTGGGCGSFDFVTSLTQAFEEMPDVFLGLLGAAISNLPMLVLCYASPSLCDLAKHWQGIINLAIQARYAQCQQMQTAMAYLGMQLRGGATSQCLEDEVNQGSDISSAMNRCYRELNQVRSPRGGNQQSVELVGETLQAAGANAEVQALAENLLGTITISAGNGGITHSQTRRPGAFLQRFERHQNDARQALVQAIAEYRTTGQVAPETLRAASVPGQPVPLAAIEALAAFEQDPLRYETSIGKLTTGLAATRLRWECDELQETLQAAADGNSHLTDAQREAISRRIEAVQRELTNVLGKATVIQQHLQPALTELLQQYAAVQEMATKAGVRAPSVKPPATPFRGQQPMGYRQ